MEEYVGNTVATLKILVTGPSAPLDYDMGMEYHHPILIMLVVMEDGFIEIYIYREREGLILI